MLCMLKHFVKFARITVRRQATLVGNAKASFAFHSLALSLQDNRAKAGCTRLYCRRTKTK